MKINSLSLTDSYNASHFKMYPPNTTEVTGYLEPRSNSERDCVSFFGLQAYIKDKLLLFIDNMDIKEAEKKWTMHGLPFNTEGWEQIKELGYLPLEIQAVPEGSFIPKDNVLLQVRNTDPRFPWLVTWFETSLVQLWYPCTVATRSKYGKLMMKSYLETTGCINIDQVLPFMLHDFGFRGATSVEGAAIGGAAHLTNFKGTDTFIALDYIEQFYGEECAGYSIPASNHAVITTWDTEDKAFQNVLDEYLKAGSIVACVSDSYDIYAAVERWGTKFKDQIVNSGGRLTIRPDSGNPEDICLACINSLMKNFGYTINEAGYKVLPDCVRLIWGDGIGFERIDDVLYFLMCNDIAAENIVFGMGAELLQKINRDTCSFAFKVNEVVQNGVRKPVSKHPINSKYKVSKAGRLRLINTSRGYMTIPEVSLPSTENVLRTVFKDGELLIDEDFETIRERAKV